MLMGSSFLLTAVHNTSDSAWIALYEGLDEIVRIERLISSWQASSETSSINRNAGIKPVKVSEELFRLIQRAKKISKLSNGYFDISFASAERYWTFDGSVIPKPSDEEVKATVSKVNYEHIICDDQNQSVFLKDKGMRIGFGAIGKGYAANRASEKMKIAGALSGVVNAGGDLMCWGTKPDGSAWQVGIINPNRTDQVDISLNAVNYAVVTSGNYLKFVEIEGTRYGHIIDPKTGWPAKGLVSVTIIC
ncbi:MAG: thiamine biosynthesis lipoprotein, partial [Limisphaerales bacterium]